MLRGLTTVSFYADDLEAASRWYAEFLAVEPYFRVPGYIEFRIGDYEDELGIIDREYAPAGAGYGPGGEIVFWHVDDLAATVDRLISLGARSTSRSRTAGTASSPRRWWTRSATSWAS